MALSLQIGFPNVPKSITNKDVDAKDAFDVSFPMSFLQFIKIITVTFEPDSIQLYYNHYIKLWNNQNSQKDVTSESIIVEKYRDFLQDIVIHYTTLEEKKFLSSIDFNDPLDLDIALGFYSKKLKELCLFYNEKRNNIKFSATRNKIIGTNFGASKTIHDLTLSYLKTLEDSKILLNFEDISQKLNVEIEELYDNYPIYYNQLPNERIYDNKDLDYGLDIFLKSDEDLVNEVFSGFSDTLKNIKEVDLLFENKRKLTKKYVSTDFYYLSTGSTVTDIISGKLFDSDNKILNLINRDYPTTASTERLGGFKTSHFQGFFRPSKMSIVLVDGLQKSFSFNTKNLQPNTIYYFPDPYIVGDNGGIITFSVDDSFLIKNESSGDASDQPSTSNFDTKYYGYTSKTAPTYSKGLDVITNFGYIKDSKKDIYGNDYGLFNTSTPRYVEYTDNLTPTVIQNIIFDGYVFYDTLFSEGSAFDYTTEDLLTYTELKRTGLSLNGGNFTTTSFDGTLFFGVFGQSTTNLYNSGASEIIYNEVYTPIPPISPELATTYEILEGGFFINTNNIPYPDAVSSDLSAFEISTGQFYYTDLIEGGINTTTQRALLDALYPALTARFIPYNRYTVNNVDGDMFLTPFEVEFTSPTPGYTYDNSVSFVTELLPPLDVGGLSGVLMIKNSSSGNILPILDTLPYLTNKYPSYVIDELVDSVIKFEVSNSFLFVETYNYLVIEKILFNNGTFEDPKSKGIYVQHSDNTYSKLSNRFKVDNSVYYYKLVYTATDTPTNFLLYPQIYKFDMLNMENRVIFPSPNDTINNFFNVSGGDIQYVMADDAVITHSSRNDIFNISFLLKDQNNVPRIYSLDYYLNPLPIFISNNVYDFAINSMSNIFNNSLPSTIYMYLSSPTVPSFQNTELVL